MDARLDTYDWAQAFAYAGEPPLEDGTTLWGDGRVDVTACEGATVAVTPFGRADVKKVIALEDGCNDGPSWIGVFKLKDGRYAFLSAGCDYTGWDCQAGGAAIVSDSLPRLIKFGLGDDDRERLGL